MRSAERMEVVVTDIKMSFWSIVVLMVKWAIATIPAFLILWAVGTIFFVLAGAFWPHFHGMPMR